jgi:gluconolactonase
VTAFTELASGLEFPEGPVVLPDGSIAVMEIANGHVTRVWPDGRKTLIADVGGGPNGAALGPDGRLYICNNGGLEFRRTKSGLLFSFMQALPDYTYGSIQRVDIDSGAVETLYTEGGGNPLRGPNDIVFDRHGGFYFTDMGKVVGRMQHRGAVYYAKADGSLIRELVFPLYEPNGIGLSPDGTALYVAETETGRVYRYDVTAPGELAGAGRMGNYGALHCNFGGTFRCDSLAVDGAGNVCVANVGSGSIGVIAPDGTVIERVDSPEPFVTNICFGGKNLRTAYLTLSGTGRLVSMPWPRPGLALNY